MDMAPTQNLENIHSTKISTPELIRKKRDGEELSAEDIETFIEGVVDGCVQGPQIGAMLMALFIRGMSNDETMYLTRAMMLSGETLEWPESWQGLVVDKHSTGGVGDKVSLALAPALAACGLKVPMISGRGLGFTGGTLDKLESIPGFSVEMQSDAIQELMSSVGCCIVGQTERLVPADRILYAQRDVTSTVGNTSLITASVISKKAAESLDGLILDVKFGRGALMKTVEEARELAMKLVSTSGALGTKTTALLTRMDCPLGKCVGNALEVAEAIQCLHGTGPRSLHELVCQLGGNLLYSVGKAASTKDGYQQLHQSLCNGTAMYKFCSMLKHQGVNSAIADKLCKQGQNVYEILPVAIHKTTLNARCEGYIHEIGAMAIAQICCSMGAGRTKSDQTINYAVGIQLLFDVGDYIHEGEPWVTVHHDSILNEEDIEKLHDSLIVSPDKLSGTNYTLVADVITSYN